MALPLRWFCEQALLRRHNKIGAFGPAEAAREEYKRNKAAQG